jgi:predicted glycoside hydrolase/deacetylase ChbG (UPF0249 family)
MKKIILCADDFGQSAAISAGIMQLVQAQRLSAASCMTEGDSWSENGPALARWRDRIDIGLHFNLTHRTAAQSFATRPLNTILLNALSGRIDGNALATTLHSQLDRFESVLGAPPDFVDGHQHVHIFPGIRSALLRELKRRYPHKKPYLRTVNPRLRDRDGALKLGVLKLLNSGFVAAAGRNGLPSTRGFGGVYSLQANADFAALMQRWLHAARNGDLFMCHPGSVANDAADPIAATRSNELRFLNSAEFVALLVRTNVQLSRFRDL